MPRPSESAEDCELYVISVRKVTGRECLELQKRVGLGGGQQHHGYHDGRRKSSKAIDDEPRAGPSGYEPKDKSSRYEPRTTRSVYKSRRSRSPSPPRRRVGAESRSRSGTSGRFGLIGSLLAATCELGGTVVNNISDVAQSFGGKIIELRDTTGSLIAASLDMMQCGSSMPRDVATFAWTTASHLAQIGWKTFHRLGRFGWTTSRDVIGFGCATSRDVSKFGWTISRDIISHAAMTIRRMSRNLRDKPFRIFLLIGCLFAVVAIYREMNIADYLQHSARYAGSMLRQSAKSINIIERSPHGCWNMIVYYLQHPMEFLKKFCVLCPN